MKRAPWCNQRSNHLKRRVVHLFTSSYNGNPVCSWCMAPKKKG